MIRMWSPWDTILGHVCATQRSQIWWVTTKVNIRNYIQKHLSEPETEVVGYRGRCVCVRLPSWGAGWTTSTDLLVIFRVRFSVLVMEMVVFMVRVRPEPLVFSEQWICCFFRDKLRWQWSDLSCDHRWPHLILSFSAQCLLRDNRKSFLCRCVLKTLYQFRNIVIHTLLLLGLKYDCQ